MKLCVYFFGDRRLDYFVVSERLLPRVTDVVIRSKVYGSDHCPLIMGLADHAQLPRLQYADDKPVNADNLKPVSDGLADHAQLPCLQDLDDKPVDDNLKPVNDE